MTADLSSLCLAGKVFPSGATWCCNLPKGHAGDHDDGLGEQWSSAEPEQEPRATTTDTYAGIPVRRGLFGCDDWQRMAEDLMAFQDAVQEALGTEDAGDVLGAIARLKRRPGHVFIGDHPPAFVVEVAKVLEAHVDLDVQHIGARMRAAAGEAT